MSFDAANVRTIFMLCKFWRMLCSMFLRFFREEELHDTSVVHEIYLDQKDSAQGFGEVSPQLGLELLFVIVEDVSL